VMQRILLDHAKEGTKGDRMELILLVPFVCMAVNPELFGASSAVIVAAMIPLLLVAVIAVPLYLVLRWRRE
jgi:hypothetical protein